MESGGLFVAERAGINLYAERSLHAALKAYLAEPGDRLEVPVDGRVVDLVRADGELVEVQTRSLGALLPKLRAFSAAGRRVRVVHPIILGSTLAHLDPESGVEISRRKSPKKGDLYSVFDELVRASELIALGGVALELVSVRVVETRVRDGSGSWRRKGDRVADRFLECIEERRVFCSRADWLSLIPAELAPPWDSGTLGEALGIKPERARKMLYVFARAGFLSEAGKAGRRKLYAPVPVSAPRGRARTPSAD
ncbi:MAG TPA: hypothetical protein PKW82_03950 [Spirochaetales bacterium]|nr:hypothetical protein [Spirochaetales bacterium]